MRDAERPAETRALSGSGAACDQKPQNVEFCVCDYPCGNQGTCCDCIRNHWGNAVYPTPACMR